MPGFRVLRRVALAGALLATGWAIAPTSSPAGAATGTATGPAVELPQSFLPPTGQLVGAHPSSAPLTVTVALQPNNPAALSSLLTNLYDPTSAQYQHWLAKGQFNSMFAPSATQIAQVTSYLQSQGLQIQATPSPFLVRATGTTSQVEAAFGTQVADYQTANHTTYFANTSAIKVPVSLSGIVSGVGGLNSSARVHPQDVVTRQVTKNTGAGAPVYGGGPGGSGLTPSQITSIYDAKGVYAAGARGQGAGKILAVFELSGYTRSDITTYEHTFFGPSENVPLVDVNVDGGPLHPVCPPGDTCYPGYYGDVEVNADIEMQIAVAPKIQGILVYNAPNDYTGQTEVDEYMQIANDDLADSISSSWAACEQDWGGIGIPLMESIAFQEMAAQGQSMFASSGDSGAWGCQRGSGNPALAVLDPASQPWVTGVGGTSFEQYDPMSNPNPPYPTGSPAGIETVWNPLASCTSEASCPFGASGGGNSIYWGRPSYQYGPGVTTKYTQYKPYCYAAAAGQACREVPDVSANADEFTGYAEYCTGNPSTDSACAYYEANGYDNVPGWLQIGGTSLASPLWSAIAALWDSYHSGRAGNINPAVYSILRSSAYNTDFHDITGAYQLERSNGYFPVTPYYDQATGVGTPDITALAEYHP